MTLSLRKFKGTIHHEHFKLASVQKTKSLTKNGVKMELRICLGDNE